MDTVYVVSALRRVFLWVFVVVCGGGSEKL